MTHVVRLDGLMPDSLGVQSTKIMLDSYEVAADIGFHDFEIGSPQRLLVTVEVWLASARMRTEGMAPVRLSHGRAADLYWTPAQMLAHHTSNGCNLNPGDLFASGTSGSWIAG